MKLLNSYRMFVATAALALCSCTALTTAITDAPNISPSAVANQTTLDERGLLGAEVSYKAARTLMEAAVDAGQVKPGLAVKFYRLNGQLNGALVRARNAYDGVNAASMDSALSDAGPLIIELWQLVAEQGKSNG